jgi:hypothetical protein
MEGGGVQIALATFDAANARGALIGEKSTGREWDFPAGLAIRGWASLLKAFRIIEDFGTAA